MRGFQGDRIGSPGHVLACVKHFAGYGAAEGGRDYDAANLSDAQMWNVYLPPFKAAVDAGAGSPMSAVHGPQRRARDRQSLAAHGRPSRRLGVRGFVVSDAFAIASLMVHGYALDAADAAMKAFQAGVNMEMA